MGEGTIIPNFPFQNLSLLTSGVTLKCSQELWESQTVKLTQSTSEQRYAKLSSRDQVVPGLERSEYIPYMFNVYQKQQDVSQKGPAREAEKSKSKRQIWAEPVGERT